MYCGIEHMSKYVDATEIKVQNVREQKYRQYKYGMAEDGEEPCGAGIELRVLVLVQYFKNTDR